MADSPTETGSSRVLGAVGVLVVLALLAWFLAELGGGGEPAVRPEVGVVTDALLAPDLEALAVAVDGAPGDDSRRAALGRAYEANELYEPAAATWRQLVEANPDEWTWKYRLAITTERLGDLDAALETMQQAASLSPRDVIDPHWRQALWLVDAGRPDEAHVALQQAEAIDAGATPVRVAKVRLALSEGRAAEAEDMILRYRLTSSLPGGYGWHLMGRALRRQDRIEEARDAWSRAGDVRPRFSDSFSEEMSSAVGGLRALKVACTAQAREAEWTAVLQLASRILRHEPDDVITRRFQAIAWLRTGNTEGARTALLELVEEAPSPTAFAALASTYLAMAKEKNNSESLRAALDTAERGLRLDPNSRGLLVIKGRAEGMLGQPRVALDSLRRAWNLDQAHATTLELAVTATNDADAWVDSIDLAEALYRQQPSHPLAGAGYALGLAQAGRIKEARAVLASLKGRRIHADLRARARDAVESAGKEPADDS